MAKQSYSLTYCNGKLVTGPDRGNFYTTLALVVCPEIVFLIVTIPDLFDVIGLGTIAILIANLYLWLLCLASLIYTSLTDPGIIPRGPEMPEDPSNPWKNLPPSSQNIMLAGEEYELKWCNTCNIYRPPRATHCGTCNNCVDRFDHHCPWTGNCIGRRNYQSFLIFVYSVMFNCLYVGGFGIACLALIGIRDDKDFTGLFEEGRNIVTGLLVIYCALAECSVAILGGLHCLLVFKSQTTNEHIKGTYTNRKNPFNEGCLKNFCYLWCAPGYGRFTTLQDSNAESNGKLTYELSQRS
mmetsp:Transcript_29492/g.41508  ORF Transcript_29492/g.41508 Transcript_29492/m.41508 type:complete len:296 (+) Transcript_29492:85-972(+)